VYVYGRYQRVQSHYTVGRDLVCVGCLGPRCRSTDDEGTHGHLGARLADRLRGNNADRLADVDQMSARQVATVAHRADAITGFTGDWRTHFELVNTHLFERGHPLLVEHDARRDYHFAAAGLDHIFRHHPTENAIAEGLDDIAAGDDRSHAQPLVSAAVVLGDDEILRHVDQATGQITRVRSFQGSIGQAFTRAVRRDEVLEYVQAFAEVCSDRRFDDRAVGLRHQPAHAGQLTNLRGRAPGARIGIHVHRVERRLTLFLALFIDDRLGRQAFHHGLGDQIVGARPNVDDLVVLLTLGYQTGSVLLFDLLHFVVGATDDFHLGGGNLEVVDTDRGAGARREFEAGVHQLIGEDDRRFQTDLAVALVENTRDGFLGHRLVDQIEAQAQRHYTPQQHAPDSRIDQLDNVVLHAFFGIGHFADTAFHARLQVGSARLVGAVHLFRVGEDHVFTRRIDARPSHPVQAEHDVLRRHDDRLAVGGRQDVVGRHHQRAGF